MEPTETGDTETENMVGGGEGRKNETKALQPLLMTRIAALVRKMTVEAKPSLLLR